MIMVRTFHFLLAKFYKYCCSQKVGQVFTSHTLDSADIMLI